jgi:hypothetical protein
VAIARLDLTPRQSDVDGVAGPHLVVPCLENRKTATHTHNVLRNAAQNALAFGFRDPKKLHIQVLGLNPKDVIAHAAAHEQGPPSTGTGGLG